MFVFSSLASCLAVSAPVKRKLFLTRGEIMSGVSSDSLGCCLLSNLRPGGSWLFSFWCGAWYSSYLPSTVRLEKQERLFWNQRNFGETDPCGVTPVSAYCFHTTTPARKQETSSLFHAKIATCSMSIQECSVSDTATV